MAGSFLILAADIGEIIGGIVGVIFIVLWVLGQVGGLFGGGKQQAHRQRGPRGPAPDAAPEEEDVRGQAEAFLQRVLGEQSRDRDEEPARAKMAMPSEYVAAEPVEAEIVEADEPLSSLDHLGSSTFSSGSSGGLGKLVGTSNEALERHLHDVFDHQLGGLGDTAGQERGAGSREAAELVPVPTSADDIRDMFADVENLRKAVILREVIDRPADRW